MPRVEYRVLDAVFRRDILREPRSSWLVIRHSEVTEPVQLQSQATDPVDAALELRALFIRFLNSLGKDGWRVTYYQPRWEQGRPVDWPIGLHFLAYSVG